MFWNFFAKYEQNVDMKKMWKKTNFCSKNDQIIRMNNMPKKLFKKTREF
jgi:hypothetical protein